MYKFVAMAFAVLFVSLVATAPAQAGGRGCCCVHDAASTPSVTPAVPEKGRDMARAPEATRRYSYEPSMDARSTTTYQPRYYRGGMRSRSSAPAWSLQKTDDAKYRVGR